MVPPTYTYVDIQVVEDGQVVVVNFNRPQSGNSLLPQMLSELVSAWKWANCQEEVRVIIQSGAGRFFNTGMDLVNSEGMSFAIGSDFHELNRLLIVSEKVIIAAVNGPAVGYGVSVLALFDLVYSVPDAYFFTPFVKWGMAAEGGSSFTFPKLMGHQRTAALFLAGERITAQEALSLGLVNKIFSKDELLNKALEVARRMSRSPPGSLKATKKLMKESVIQQLLDANDRECAHIHSERYRAKEYEEAIKTFKIEQLRKQSSKSRL